MMLVANCKTERHSELPALKFKLDFWIRHQHQCVQEPKVGWLRLANFLFTLATALLAALLMVIVWKGLTLPCCPTPWPLSKGLLLTYCVVMSVDH